MELSTITNAYVKMPIDIAINCQVTLRSATNRLITSKDHASVQINVGSLDASGVYQGDFTTFALCGFVRAQGDADSALDRLWQKKKVEARQS
ncbi:hypothetical protein RJ639_023563 [Escallonia herrerae]|uniref:40S ribosomal protein S21 n=1 Tax=Escallonia herrerae TaxID=1293975 RepID=A0AA89ADX8_9ASTE|nr:hypothetical protein RJ639_025974 [Escallonia herrerae]KAK2998666.1 hypothetical protein RJ639_023563 [Escallonia herrerae]